MSIQQLYDAARAILDEHNAVLGNNSPARIDPDAFILALQMAGGTAEDRLKLSHEKLLPLLTSSMDLGKIPISEQEKIPKPVAIASAIAKVLRGGTDTSKDERRPISDKKASRMTLKELVENFDPEEPTSTIGERLSKIAEDEPFIVYLDGREIDVEATLTLLKEVKKGYEGRELYGEEGEEKKVYAIGELPDNDVEENPIYRGRPLRPDGTCDQLSRSWEGISQEVRQFIAFALEHESGPEIEGDRDKAWALFDHALAGMKQLRKRYAKVAVDFDEAKKKNALPNLLITLNQSADFEDDDEEESSPFEHGQEVAWMANPLANNNAYFAVHKRDMIDPKYTMRSDKLRSCSLGKNKKR